MCGLVRPKSKLRGGAFPRHTHTHKAFERTKGKPRYQEKLLRPSDKAESRFKMIKVTRHLPEFIQQHSLFRWILCLAMVGSLTQRVEEQVEAEGGLEGLQMGFKSNVSKFPCNRAKLTATCLMKVRKGYFLYDYLQQFFT